MNRERIEQVLRGEPVIWSRISKCGREPAVTEAMDQLRFKIAWYNCTICPEVIKGYLPKDLYDDLCDLSTVLTWLQFLPTDEQKALRLLQCGISQGAKWCKLPRSTYYTKVQNALDKLSELLVNH